MLNRHASTRRPTLVGMALGFVFLSLYLLVPVVEELTHTQLLSEYVAAYCKDGPFWEIGLNRGLCWASLAIGLVRVPFAKPLHQQRSSTALRGGEKDVPTQVSLVVARDSDLYTLKWYIGVPCLLIAGTAAVLVARNVVEDGDVQSLIVILLYPSIVYMNSAMVLAVGVSVWVVCFLAWFALSIDYLSWFSMLMLLAAGVLSVSKVSGGSHNSIGRTTAPEPRARMAARSLRVVRD